MRVEESLLREVQEGNGRGETKKMKGLVKCTHISSKHSTNEGSATACRQTGCVRNRPQEFYDFTIIFF